MESETSPVWVYDETLDGSVGQAADKEELARQSSLRRPYEVGSIGVLNERISTFERDVSNDRPRLVLETAAADYRAQVKCRQTTRGTARENESVTRESLRSLSSAENESKHQQRSRLGDKAPVSAEHVLVELAEYPGFDDNTPTALPESLNSKGILHTIIRAQTDLQRKPVFKIAWEDLFLSDQSEAVFLDCFWCYFLLKFQPDQTIQDRLFHRTAFNYVDLLQSYIDPRYREPFFKRYPDCICQAIYHSFFVAYPTSYQQFGEDFKTALCNFTHLWLTGIQPVPRCWLSWNFDVLEPVNMFKMVAEQEKSKEKELVKDRSVDVYQMLGLPRDDHSSHTNQRILQSDASVTDNSQSDMKLTSSSKATVSTRSQLVAHRRRQNTPPTIRATSGTAVVQKKLPGSSQRESCPVGQGPEFDRLLFNVNGHSPLVSYFLSVVNASPDTEVLQLTQRTEIVKLPPLGAKTYHSVVKESMKSTKETDCKCRSLWEDEKQETGHQMHLRALERKADIKKSEKLLTQTKEVRRLTNLLTVELLQQNTSEETRTTESAVLEIEKALAKQEIN